jgi:ankyrin repeat protein
MKTQNEELIMLRKQLPPSDYIQDFHKAIRECNINQVSFLIQIAKDNHYDLNSHDTKSKYTLLHFTITKTTEHNEKNMLTILQLLKDAGNDLNQHALDSLQNTPIHSASRRALPNILFWLLQNGAHKEVRDVRGKTAMDYVEKQYQCQATDMNEHHKQKLKNVLDILAAPEKNNIVVPSFNLTKNICRIGFFAVAAVTMTTAVALSNMKMEI